MALVIIDLSVSTISITTVVTLCKNDTDKSSANKNNLIPNMYIIYEIIHLNSINLDVINHFDLCCIIFMFYTRKVAATTLTICAISYVQNISMKFNFLL